MVCSSLFHHLCSSENNRGSSQVRACLLQDSVENRACCMQGWGLQYKPQEPHGIRLHFQVTQAKGCLLPCGQGGIVDSCFSKRPTMVLLSCLYPRVHGSCSNGTSPQARGNTYHGESQLGVAGQKQMRLSPRWISEFFRCSSCSVKYGLARVLFHQEIPP